MVEVERGEAVASRPRGAAAFLVPLVRSDRGFDGKKVAAKLGMSEITVKAQRAKVTRKMKADSFADLVNMAAALRLAPEPKG